mgnify:CR=1 FL=1
MKKVVSWYYSPQYLKSLGENNFGFIPEDFSALRTKGLRVASSIVGDFSQVRIGSEISFCALEEGKRIDGYGLECFIEGNFLCNRSNESKLSVISDHFLMGRVDFDWNKDEWKWVFFSWENHDIYSVPWVIFDNHNHALYYWCKYLLGQNISLGSSPKIPVVHIDMHSDLWKNINSLNVSCFEWINMNSTSSSSEKCLGDAWKEYILEYIADFVNTSCTVANYIDPAIRSGIIGEVIRIEGEQDLLEKWNRIFSSLFFLNIDLDFFADELDDIDFSLKKRVIHHYLAQKPFVTVATSPFFISSEKALEVFRRVFFD